MISIILLSIAAILNAFMDRIDDENIHQSIAKNWNWKFWYKRESDKYAKMIGGYRLDGWHITKSLMIITISLCAVLHKPVFVWWIELIISGIVWNLVFNVFYNKIFYKK